MLRLPKPSLSAGRPRLAVTLQATSEGGAGELNPPHPTRPGSGAASRPQTPTRAAHTEPTNKLQSLKTHTGPRDTQVGVGVIICWVKIRLNGKWLPRIIIIGPDHYNRPCSYAAKTNFTRVPSSPVSSLRGGSRTLALSPGAHSQPSLPQKPLCLRRSFSVSGQRGPGAEGEKNPYQRPRSLTKAPPSEPWRESEATPTQPQAGAGRPSRAAHGAVG